MSSEESSSASSLARRLFAVKNVAHRTANVAAKIVAPQNTPVTRFAYQKTLSSGTICASATQRIAAITSANAALMETMFAIAMWT